MYIHRTEKYGRGKNKFYTLFVIHCSNDDSNLVVPMNIESWNILLRAAKIRGHSPILDLAKDLPEGGIPTILYHRNCRGIFTLKKTLDYIL